MIQKIINKLLSLYIRLRWRSTPPEYRYFIRDTYNCQIAQWKYFFRDYVLPKRTYKRISFNGEFACELQYVLPFAYWHYKNGTLKNTEAALGTKSLYFFSPEHLEVYDARSNEGNYNFEVPRVLYSHNYNMRKWIPVPLKEHFMNDCYQYEKPMLVIANRYNSEWDGPPISFFSMELLEQIIEKTRHAYKIIYNRPRPHQITEDNSVIYDLNEFGWLKEKYPEVILMEDLYNENRIRARDFNEFQFSVYANADRFLSIHGGTSVLASYFKGKNIILSKQGPEHYFNCYNKLYPKLSGAQIFHAKTDEQVLTYVAQEFV